MLGPPKERLSLTLLIGQSLNFLFKLLEMLHVSRVSVYMQYNSSSLSGQRLV